MRNKNSFKILIVALSVILLVVILVVSIMLQEDTGIPDNGGTTSSSQTDGSDNKPEIEIEPEGDQQPNHGFDIPFDDI